MHATISDQVLAENDSPVHTVIGARLRQLRNEKKLSQVEIEQRTGLLRCYVSRVEHGHTVPSLDTLERFASALEVPLYRLFYQGDEPPTPLASGGLVFEDLVDQTEQNGAYSRFLRKLGGVCRRITESDRKALLVIARKLVARCEG